MINPFKKKGGNATSIASSHDTIVEEKNLIDETEDSNTMEQSDLQFFVRVSSVVHSLENECNGLIIAIHNPTNRCSAVLLDDWSPPRFNPAMKSSLRADISNNTVIGNSKYARFVTIRTLDMGWNCVGGWWNLINDWKFRRNLLIINSGHTHYISAMHEPKATVPRPKQDLGPFKLKTYQTNMLMDFNCEQWNNPDFQACLSSPCHEFGAAARHPCGVCNLKSKFRRKVDTHLYRMIQHQG
ncbi:hypothetical protein H2200_000521 [Cladophialophora chaetospira]|uniref:Uncharacterized protein n=1 Tax=Cladophialophora chaetospira TaxID=386627 RepID=A0AA38XNQ3_9EURO|nr:hypothetical protein H2200_000521 [Cladophialophora chaetospira]